MFAFPGRVEQLDFLMQKLQFYVGIFAALFPIPNLSDFATIQICIKLALQYFTAHLPSIFCVDDAEIYLLRFSNTVLVIVTGCGISAPFRGYRLVFTYRPRFETKTIVVGLKGNPGS